LALDQPNPPHSTAIDNDFFVRVNRFVTAPQGSGEAAAAATANDGKLEYVCFM